MTVPRMHPRCGGSGSGPIPGSGAKWNLRNDRERESGPRYDRVRVFPHIRAFVSNRPGAHRGFDYKGVIEMTETQVTWLTQESHDRLKSELDQLISNRPVIAAEINGKFMIKQFGRDTCTTCGQVVCVTKVVRAGTALTVKGFA